MSKIIDLLNNVILSQIYSKLFDKSYPKESDYLQELRKYYLSHLHKLLGILKITNKDTTVKKSNPPRIKISKHPSSS